MSESDIKIRNITVSRTFVLANRKTLCKLLAKPGFKPSINKFQTRFKGFSGKALWY